MMDAAAKPGHLKKGGEISLVQTEKTRAALRKARQREAAERKQKPEPVVLGWVRT